MEEPSSLGSAACCRREEYGPFFHISMRQSFLNHQSLYILLNEWRPLAGSLGAAIQGQRAMSMLAMADPLCLYNPCTIWVPKVGFQWVEEGGNAHAEGAKVGLSSEIPMA